jgi:hypothetical protein
MEDRGSERPEDEREAPAAENRAEQPRRADETAEEQERRAKRQLRARTTRTRHPVFKTSMPFRVPARQASGPAASSTTNDAVPGKRWFCQFEAVPLGHDRKPQDDR